MSDSKGHGESSGGSQDFLGLYPGTGNDYAAFCAELDYQTSRGVAVLGAAFLDWRVTSALRTRLYRCELPNVNPKDKPHDFPNKLFGSIEKPGELGYIDKCKMAYCLGLVGEAGFRDLERIGQIRNRFAHQLNVRTFTGDSKVVKYCMALETPKIVGNYMDIANREVPYPVNIPKVSPDPEQRYRADFLYAVHWLVMMLAHTSESKIKWPDHKSGMHEWSGMKCGFHVFW